MKYEDYKNTAAYKELMSLGYSNVLSNIISDDETYVTQQMKLDFFEHLKCHDGVCKLTDYCEDFFARPEKSTLDQKAYLLKGPNVGQFIYNSIFGRVSSKDGFRYNLNKSIFKNAPDLTYISDEYDETLLDTYLKNDYEYNSSVLSINDLIEDVGISNIPIQNSVMWTFTGIEIDNPFSMIELKDLPCLLGLPGPNGLPNNYDKIKRVAFQLKIPTSIEVKKPTAFDAGLMDVWRPGGKTKPHLNCEKKFNGIGLDEYIHLPVTFGDIVSDIYITWIN